MRLTRFGIAAAAEVVTFDDGTSGVRSSGTYDRTFDVPDDFTYRCSLHGDMLGRIVVTGGKE